MRIALVLGLALAPIAAQAESHADAAAGEKVFKKCQACHVVQDPDGNVLAGKSGKSGPNLYGVIGRQAGTVEGFKYKKSIVEAGEAGLVWTEEELAAFVQDPTKYLRARLNDDSARSAMTLKLREDEDAANIAAFLAQFGDPEG